MLSGTDIAINVFVMVAEDIGWVPALTALRDEFRKQSDWRNERVARDRADYPDRADRMADEALEFYRLAESLTEHIKRNGGDE